MARARNIKPGFFKNEILAELNPLARILFAGLWCLADREGRLEDRPKRIKADILPYDNCNINKLLNELQGKEFILRYEVRGNQYIQVLNFKKHQNPHMREPASEIPAPDEHSASTVQEPDEHRTSPADSLNLIPDSLNLIPDSPLPNSGPAILESAPLVPTKKRREEMFTLFWQAYPNKKSKGQAEKAWDKIKPDELLFELIMSKLQEARSSPNWTKEGGKYIPYPATWLNAKGWEDEYTQGMDVPDAWNVLAPYMREDDPSDPKRYS